MPSPFPGMDPFLEDPAVFPDLHDRLIFCLSEALNAVLPAPYFTGIASRVWVEASRRRIEPDVNVLRPGQTVNGGGHAGGGGRRRRGRSRGDGAGRHRDRASEEVREAFLEIHARAGRRAAGDDHRDS